MITDQLGLGWVPEVSDPRWSFDFDDLAAAGAVAGLSAFRIDRSVYVLSRSLPPVPDLPSRLRHVARRIAMLPRRTASAGRHALTRIAQKSIKRLR
jgi:hypothetical protein